MATVYWSKPAAGEMDVDDLRVRRLYVAEINLSDVGVTVYWTRDGNSSGTNLMSSSYCPLVQVMIQSRGQSGTFTCNGQWGLMFRSGIGAQQDGYAWKTDWSGSCWYTVVVPSTSATQNAATQASRLCFVYAMGRGA